MKPIKNMTPADIAANLARRRAARDALLKDPAMRAIYDEEATEIELAHQLAELRRRAGKTQAELADILGTTQSAVARVETGRRARLETVVRYARACGHRSARLALVDARGRPLVRVQPR